VRGLNGHVSVVYMGEGGLWPGTVGLTGPCYGMRIGEMDNLSIWGFRGRGGNSRLKGLVLLPRE
jgi:hypothetical protein